MFVINIVRPGTIAVRRAVHTSSCRYAGLARRSYRLDAAAVTRLFSRQHRGDGDQLTASCHYCDAGRLATLITDAT